MLLLKLYNSLNKDRAMNIGDKIPNFSCEATNNLQVTQESLLGKQTIFFFYPKDNTSGCTTENIEFSQAYEQFKALNTQIFGISRDSLRTHNNFKEKFELKTPLLADTEEKLCQLFDVIKLKKNHGKEYHGIERSTFIIDENGILTHEFRKVSVKEHVQTILNILKG